MEGKAKMNDTLFPEHEWDFVEKAVERVKMAWTFHHHMNPDGKPMLLAYSGGKDSTALFFICKQAAEEIGLPMEQMFHVQYNLTNVDPPELVYFIRDVMKKQYPFIEIHHPKKTMWKLIEEKGFLPTMRIRYCCKELKESSNVKGGYTLTGVRRAESIKRSKRLAYEALGSKKRKFGADKILANDNTEDRRENEYCMQQNAYVCNPIIDWSDEDVWHFIRGKGLPYCKLYDEGFERLGCIGCPMASTHIRVAEFERWPGYKACYIRAAERGRDKRKKHDSGEEFFAWWIKGEFQDTALQEETLFEEIENV